MDVDIEEEMGLSLAHFIAGALAGTAEHCGMYPIDTIKTHFQATTKKRVKLSEITKDIVYRGGGFKGFFSGMTAVIMGAAPAHAIYFASWEFFKRQLGARVDDNELYTLQSGLAGVIATLMSDAVLTPMDAVKQKRQLALKHYTGSLDCFRKVVAKEGLRALYAGYTTTVLMNVPYNFIYFPVYEAFRKFLKSDPSEYNVFAHIIAGGGAGAFSAALTNPLDVAKTRLQTQSDVGIYYKGMIDALKSIYKSEGVYGFARGMVPRMIFHSMSAGILWGTYEYVK